MRLFFANKFFTLKGSYKVHDENKQLQFYIKGKFFTFTRKKYLQTPEGLPIFTIRNKYWHWFFHTALIFDNDNTLLMKIRGKFMLRHSFKVESPLGDYRIDGDYLGWDFDIYKNEEKIAHIRRKIISFVDTYIIDIDKEDETPLMVAMAVALDNIRDHKKLKRH